MNDVTMYNELFTFWRQLLDRWYHVLITVTVVKHFVIWRQAAIEEFVCKQNGQTMLNTAIKAKW